MRTTAAIILVIILSSYAKAEEVQSLPYFQLRSFNSMKFQHIDKQTMDYSCGAASLAILLSSYFEDTVNEVTLLEDIICRLSDNEMEIRYKEGFSMLDLKHLAERLGYNATGVKLPHTAASKLRGPIIILLKKHKLNHFVVLKGAKLGRAFIADPVAGHIRIPFYDLISEWDGEALILGKAGFGLPREHDLSVPSGKNVAPEQETIRALQHTPFNTRKNL